MEPYPNIWLYLIASFIPKLLLTFQLNDMSLLPPLSMHLSISQSLYPSISLSLNSIFLSILYLSISSLSILYLSPLVLSVSLNQISLSVGHFPKSVEQIILQYFEPRRQFLQQSYFNWKKQKQIFLAPRRFWNKSFEEQLKNERVKNIHFLSFWYWCLQKCFNLLI